MLLKIRLFAGLKQVIGGDLDAEFAGDRITVAALHQRLGEEHPKLLPYLSGLAVAVNEEYILDDDHELHDGDEVALIPPISGGAPEASTSLFLVTDAVLDVAALRARVLTRASGAVVAFEGVVRDRHEGHEVLRLEYEAYTEMAERVLREVGEVICREFDIHEIAIHHRTGMLEVGDTSLVVAVSAEHRAEAFTAAHRAVDRVKESVPVWKREHGPDGATWQEGTPARPVE